jgi:hypothetical protein
VRSIFIEKGKVEKELSVECAGANKNLIKKLESFPICLSVELIDFCVECEALKHL